MHILYKHEESVLKVIAEVVVDYVGRLTDQHHSYLLLYLL